MKSAHVSRTGLLAMTLLSLLTGIVMLALFVFIPAGTLKYWQAWVYFGVLFLPLTINGFILFKRDPEVLEKRLRMRESRGAQKSAIAALTVLIALIYILSALDWRFAWSVVPLAAVFLGDLIIVAGYVLYVLTVRENRYASRSVELQQGQSVISSGPYALVRHPMYLAMTLIFVGTPLALGSLWGLAASIFFPVLLSTRISNEEKLLRESLGGYVEYTHKVKYRLIPFLW